VGLPFLYSVVASPRYQTFPSESWAYQSSVTSTGVPCSLTVSRITLATTPLAIVLVFCVTSTTAFSRFPVVSVSLETHLLPGLIGQYGLSILVVNSAGSSFTGSLP